MKRKLICWIALLCIVFSMVGCTTHSSKAFTFNVETGDAIKVKLDTSEGYDISSDLPFVISCGDETLSQGIFIPAETYAQYAATVTASSEAVVLDSGTKDGNEYIFWSYNDQEYNYAILIGDSNTGILLGNDVSEETAKECFERLTLTVAN